MMDMELDKIRLANYEDSMEGRTLSAAHNHRDYLIGKIDDALRKVTQFEEMGSHEKNEDYITALLWCASEIRDILT